MHNIKTNFDKILEVIKEIIGDQTDSNGNYLRRGTRPRFSDSEVIALSLTSECLGIDSENYLFSKLTTEYLNDFKSKILAKVIGFTTLQFLNKFINNKPVERVQHTLAN